MASTFLEMCQQVVEDAGISGTFSTVVGQTGEFARVVSWTNRACKQIEQTFFNWNFLHVFHSFTTTVSISDYPPPADFNLWDVDTGQLPADEQVLEFIQWTRLKRDPTAQVSGDPYRFTVLPSNAIRLYDTPTTVQTVEIEYWKQPKDLLLDADTPFIPQRFRDIVVYKTLQRFYANYESSDEMKIFANENYSDLWESLKSSELPANQASGSVNTGTNIQVVGMSDVTGGDGLFNNYG